MTRSHYEAPLPELDLNEFDVIRSSNINPKLPLYVITHGFMEAGNRPWVSSFELIRCQMKFQSNNRKFKIKNILVICSCEVWPTNF